MRGFERPDAPRQPALERQIVGEPAKQGLAQVHVGLDQARKQDETGAIENARPRRPGGAPLSRRSISDGGDPPVLDQHVGVENAVIAVHGDDAGSSE